MKNIKIKYLYNSGFSLETPEHQFIFDYYRGPVKLENKRIIVFTSHSHPDHFNPEVFKWDNVNRNITYVFSKDVDIKGIANNIHLMSPDEQLELNGVKIKTIDSTDLGVAFLVEVDNTTIFHAGDLNWWYWWDDTPEEIRVMEKAFKKEIHKLDGENIDIAFFPVDPRLKHNYSLGGEYFINKIKPKIFIPMHFGDNYEIISKFIEKVKPYPTKVIKIDFKGQDICL